MITAQDIREKTFEKSKFGGYDMAQVDEFLEELADDLTNSQKEGRFWWIRLRNTAATKLP